MGKEGNNIACCVTQCENPLDQNYWNERWQKNETGWDIGQASPAITEYMDQYPDKNAAILIPGCGNAYEAEFLIANGFTDITLIDIAPNAVEALKEKFASKPQIKVLCEDFFNHQGSYDLIIEQTFFCAIPPAMRNEYSKKTASLLRTNGKIIGVLFDKQFDQPFPPFGGCPCEYKPIFEPYYTIKTMDECYNSIPSRANSEVFVNLIKIREMKKNLGTTDKVIRILVALIIGIFYLTNVISGTLAIILGILAMVFVLTSFISFCPLYLPFGISTFKRKIR